MRKVVLRWNISSIEGSKELSSLLKICKSLEIIAHLDVSSEGITQLVEVNLNPGHSVHELSEVPSFEVLEIHEENENDALVSLLCTHTLAKSAIDLSNLHLQCPYGIDSEKGMEMRVTGLTSSMRRFLSLLRLILPPDRVSVITTKDEMMNGWSELLTSRQIEVLSHAVKSGYYDGKENVTIKSLSEELGISRSTYGGHLSDAEKTILKRIGSDIQ